ncbi:MAG: zf-HC2 domain-containing protein, partial [Pyrinomonadaceae bacterium]
MDNLFKNNNGEEGEHPAREMLLLCADGELSPKEAAQVQAHLEACWRCRVKTKKIEEGIANIIEFDEAVLKPHLVPPHNWRNFDRRLSQLAGESGKQSPLVKVFGSLGRFFSTVHLWSMPRPLVRVAVGLLVAVLIVTLAIRFNHETTVTASELLKQATQAQAARLRATAEPVVHQRLQVRRKGQTSSREVAVNWEIWNDTKNSRVRYFVTDGGGSSATDHATHRNDRADDVSGTAVITELSQVLEANHMDPQRPLSAASYQSWRNTLEHKHDEVTRSKLSGGLDALTLRTIPVGHVNVGQIAEAVFIVRARDWQPIELRLNVAAEGGNHSYELTEDTLEVMSLAQINPAIFSGEEIASAPVQKTSPRASPTPTPIVKLNPSPQLLLIKPAQPVATADLEVEALQLL